MEKKESEGILNRQSVERNESILIVDDTPANLRLLSHILRERGNKVRAVSSGARALASIAAHPPDLVLLDIRMPAMDGYEVCRHLKTNPQTQEVPVLFISALNEIDDKVRAFAVGGLDYITKPFQLEEVVARVETHLALRRLQRTLQEANLRMERELVLAAQVQTSLMRRELPAIPGWSISAMLLPTRQTSGDFYDVMQLPDGLVALLVADVVDKGVGAALYMAMSCTLLRTCTVESPHHPEQVFVSVNRHILEDTDTDQFVTVFLGILDPGSGQLVYSNAGHNPPVMIPVDPQEPVTLLKHTGPALGVLIESQWHQQSIQIPLGATLVLYTDGVVDAENAQRDYFSLDRLIKAARQESTADGKKCSAGQVLTKILNDVQLFTSETALQDDIALMVLRH